MVDKKENERKILANRTWIKRLITPYENVRTPINVECQKGHCIECRDVRELLKTCDNSRYFLECPICKKEEYEKEYLIEKPKCLQCGTKLSLVQFKDKQKFCSQSCAAIYNNNARSTNNSFNKFLKMNDSEIEAAIDESTSFNNFCENLKFFNLSNNIKSQMKAKINQKFPNAWKSTNKKELQKNMGYNSLDIGAIGENAFVLKMLKKGIRVSKPICDAYPYDFILEKNGKMLRFQVKSSESLVNDKTYSFTISKKRYNKAICYKKDDFDFYFLYNLSDDRGFIIPLTDILGKSTIFIRKFNKDQYAGNKDEEKYFYAKNYDFEIFLEKIFNDND